MLASLWRAITVVLTAAASAVLIIVLTGVSLWVSKTKNAEEQDSRINGENNDRHGYPHQPPEVVIAHRLEGIRNQIEAQRRQHDYHEHKRHKLEVIGVRAAIIAACLAGWSAWIFQHQLEEMRADQRPWVSAVASVDEPFVYQYESNGTNVSLRYTLHNSGHSPANNIWFELATLPEFPEGDIIVLARMTCEGSVPPSNSRVALGFTLFPGDTISIEETGNISKNDIDRLNTMYRTLPGPMKIWTPMVIACVIYRSPPEGGKLHHTPLIINLQMKRSAVKAGRGCCAIFIDDSPIPASDLHAEPFVINLPAD